MKWGAKYPLSEILQMKKEEHKKNIKYFDKSFNISILSLGKEFSDGNYLFSTKPTSSNSYEQFMKKPTAAKKEQNFEVIEKITSKSNKKTFSHADPKSPNLKKTIQVKIKSSSNKEIISAFNEDENLVDNGDYYKVPKSCLDLYDDGIDAYEVVSQNNNIYNIQPTEPTSRNNSRSPTPTKKQKINKADRPKSPMFSAKILEEKEIEENESNIINSHNDLKLQEKTLKSQFSFKAVNFFDDSQNKQKVKLEEENFYYELESEGKDYFSFKKEEKENVEAYFDSHLEESPEKWNVNFHELNYRKNNHFENLDIARQESIKRSKRNMSSSPSQKITFDEIVKASPSKMKSNLYHSRNISDRSIISDSNDRERIGSAEQSKYRVSKMKDSLNYEELNTVSDSYFMKNSKIFPKNKSIFELDENELNEFKNSSFSRLEIRSSIQTERSSGKKFRENKNDFNSKSNDFSPLRKSAERSRIFGPLEKEIKTLDNR